METAHPFPFFFGKILLNPKKFITFAPIIV